MGDQIMRLVAELLATEVEDSRLAMVTVSGVRMSKDLSTAEVLYTAPSGSDPAAIEAGLKKASGFFRSRLGRQLKSKYIPTLAFCRDDFLEDVVYDKPGQDD